MNLHHLRIFYTVAQRRSVTAAAADLLLSQPAVSLQLKALEKELGMPLFQRGGAKLRLTQAGEVLHRAAVSMLHAKDEAERAITELRDGTRGRPSSSRRRDRGPASSSSAGSASRGCRW